MQEILNRQDEYVSVPVTELSDSLQEQLDEVLQQKENLEQQIEAKEKEIQEGLAKVASQRGTIEEQAARIRELEEQLEKRPEKRPARPQVSYEVQVPMEQGKPPVQIPVEPVEVERKRSNDVGRFKMLFEKRKARTDMVKLVSQADLSEGQLAAILAGMEQGLTQEQLTDTNQTRTIYRNSDGHPLVITPDGNGNWVDSDGNVYNFIDEQDAYDAEGNSYYWHGEAADVYYMPVQ